MKTRIKTLLLITCCVLFFNCNEKETDLELNSELTNDLTFGFVSEGRPDNALSYSEIITMLHQYDKTRSQALMNGLGKEDNRSVFFSKEDLKNFIEEVETISAEKRINFTGVSFLSTAYPEDYSDVTKKGERTLVLMPTTSIGGDDTIIFDPRQSESNSPSTLDNIIEDFGFKDRKKIFNTDLNVMSKATDIQSIGLTTDKEISNKELISMLSEYNTNKANVLENAIGKEDVRKSSFSLASFKSYLAYIEELSMEKNIEVSGINILFGAYPENYSLNPIKQGYMSIILMPVTSIDGRNVMFDPLNSKMNKPAIFQDILSSFGYNYGEPISKRLNFYLNRNSGDVESSGGNRAGISPPM